MSTLTEEQLTEVLHRAVPDPVEVADRAGAVRRRAGRYRRRRALGGTAVLALVAAVATPAVLSTTRNTGAAGTTASTPTVRTSPARTTGTVAATLRRPLALPALRAGQACPVSRSRRFPAGGGFSDPFTAVGAGPVYLAGGSTVRLDYPAPANSSYANSSWSGQKVIWVVDPSYTGALLLRGGQLDGTHQLRFDHYLGAIGHSDNALDDTRPYADLAYPAAASTAGSRPGIRTYPSAVRLQAPGCYAIQVDGTTFSARIVFTARPL